ERPADAAGNRCAQGRYDLRARERAESTSGKEIGARLSLVCHSERSRRIPVSFVCRRIYVRDVSTSLNMTVLALETSCDESGVAILRRRNGDSASELLASEVASQIAAHEKYGGIVPEIASRNHLIYAPRLLNLAASSANIGLSEIDAFAATSGPGLASSLMIGASIAKGLAIGFRKPYLAINHLEGHLLSPFFGGSGRAERITPNVSLVVSGGHTMLVRLHALCDYQVIG